MSPDSRKVDTCWCFLTRSMGCPCGAQGESSWVLLFNDARTEVELELNPTGDERPHAVGVMSVDGVIVRFDLEFGSMHKLGADHVGGEYRLAWQRGEIAYPVLRPRGQDWARHRTVVPNGRMGYGSEVYAHGDWMACVGGW